MRKAQTQRASFCTVFHTADHAAALTACLPLADLLTTCELSRTLHAVFDSDATWQSKMSHVRIPVSAGGDATDEKSCDEQPSARSASASTPPATAKQRYIELRGCSEHAHNQCYKLVAPEPQGIVPLCNSCRSRIAACIVAHLGKSLYCVVRTGDTSYWVFGDRCSNDKRWTAFYEVQVDYRTWAGKTTQRAVERRRKRERGREASDYRVVSKSRLNYDARLCRWNVCDRCSAGLTRRTERHKRWDNPSKWCVDRRRRMPWEAHEGNSDEDD